MRKFQLQSGRSMIEMLGVLAIIAVLTVGGIAGYSRAMMKYRTNKTVDQITRAVTNTRVAFIAQKNYAGLGKTEENVNNVILHTSILPKEVFMRGKDGDFVTPYRLKNPFRGSISMRIGDKIMAGDESAFIIHYDSIPKQACIEIATSPWGDTDGSGFVMLTINTPIAEDMNGSNCKPTEMSHLGSAIHCTHEHIMLNKAAANACKQKNNSLELMFY